MSSSSPSKEALRQTPLHAVHTDAGARMVPFAGYSMPLRYSSQVDEHHAVRKAAGMFDVSHMGEVFVSGVDAERFLLRLAPNDVSKLRIGQAHYSALLSDEGTFLDDLLVYRTGEQTYMLVVNAAGRHEDVAWIERQAEGFEVEIDDRSDATALIALQGPEAEAIVGSLGTDLSDLRYYRFRPDEIAGIDVIASRTGYTGEDGFEFYVGAEAAADLWKALADAGASRGLLPAGLAARDTLRLEAGMHLSGQDIDASVTPLEVGLGWIVKLGKEREFVGSERLRAIKRDGPRRRMIGFRLDGRNMARSGYVVRVGRESGEVSGQVTSGSWSPTLEASIGLALLDGSDSEGPLEPIEAGTPLVAEIRGKDVPGEVVALPFYRRPK